MTRFFFLSLLRLRFYHARGYSKMEDAREILYGFSVYSWGGAILRFSCCGLQVSYLGADNFGDVFSVANKAANRLDSGRVQPGILFLVVPLRVPQFIPLET